MKYYVAPKVYANISDEMLWIDTNDEKLAKLMVKVANDRGLRLTRTEQDVQN